MNDLEPLLVTSLVTDVLEKLAIPYVIGGSLASIAHGMMRTTMDADIVADMPPAQAEPFVKALQDQFYVDLETVKRAVQRQGSFNLIHLETMFKVDIFVAKDRPFDQQQLIRRTAYIISQNPERIAWILSAEDIVLAKLDWFQIGGRTSERQWRDILAVLKTQAEQLDVPYLREWASSLDVQDLLAVALAEADID